MVSAPVRILSLAEVFAIARSSLKSTARHTVPLSILGIAIPLIAFDAFFGWRSQEFSLALGNMVEGAGKNVSYLSLLNYFADFANLYVFGGLLAGAVMAGTYLRILWAMSGSPISAPIPGKSQTFLRLILSLGLFLPLLMIAEIVPIISLFLMVTSVMIPTLTAFERFGPLKTLKRAIALSYAGPLRSHRLQVFNQLLVIVCLQFLCLQGWSWMVRALAAQLPLILPFNISYSLATAVGLNIFGDLIWPLLALFTAATSATIFHQTSSPQT